MGWHVGNAFKRMSSDLDRAAIGFGGAKLKHGGRATTGDVPLLIKALSVRVPGVAADARAALTKLAGKDYGPDPARWQSWWRSREPEVGANATDLEEARLLFARLRGGFMGGDSRAVLSTFSSALRVRWGLGRLEKFVRASEAPLRRAYRDATVTAVRVDGNRGSLVIDWGEWGFEFAGLPLVLEGGRWRVAARPWARKVVRTQRLADGTICAGDLRRPRGDCASEARVRGWTERASRRRWASAATMLAVFVAYLGLWLLLTVGLRQHVRFAEDFVLWGVPAACAAGLVWLMFSRFRTSRDIRREFREKHGSYPPTARGLR